jgi:cellulose synthase/poly-beta-1,6-N-acetylglucosamine synthase-like glycosyltransferase
MRAPITVVTASIPGREQLLGTTLASVYAQTVEVEAHLVMAQSCTEHLVPPHHVAIQQNWLLPAVRSEFTMRLADDDQLLPHHIETMLPHLDDYDVVYSYDANGDRPRLDCTNWPQDQLVDTFRRQNWIDGSASAIRTSLLREVGGWPEDYVGGNHMTGEGGFVATGLPAEDWACYLNLAIAGARFLCIPEPTWRYGNGNWVRSSTHGWAP